MVRKHSRAKSRHTRITNENTEQPAVEKAPIDLENMSPNPIFMTKGSIVLQNQQYLLQRRVMQQVYGAYRVANSQRRVSDGAANLRMSDEDPLLPSAK